MMGSRRGRNEEKKGRGNEGKRKGGERGRGSGHHVAEGRVRGEDRKWKGT